jgi:tRNA(Arg) A34 adenosine deaminase TadA
MKKAPIRAATCAALDSNFRMRHGAALYKGGKVYKTSFNQPGFSSFGARFREIKHFASCHAELVLILNVDAKVTKGADVYVARLSSEGKLANSKPCSMCENALRYCGIRRVFYSNNDQTWSCMYLGN